MSAATTRPCPRFRGRLEQPRLPGRHLDDVVAAERRARRVGPVRARRDQHAPRATVIGMIRPHDSMPASSPCAPAAGWADGVRPTAGAPPQATRLERALGRAPAEGCSPANPGRRAISSFTTGLYFIVHEPSGYMVVAAL